MKDDKYLKFIIVGFSGAGKTHYLESLLKSGARGEDLDQLIVNGLYSNTQEMIEKVGMASFRESEFSALKNWMNKSSPGEYLSLGGGAIHSESLKWLNERDDWQAIYIKKSFDECLVGMKKRAQSYLLKIKLEDVRALYKKRLELYIQLKNIRIFIKDKFMN